MRNWIAGALVVAGLGANAASGAAGEIRLGVLAHDPLIQKEEGVDLNAEYFFNSWSEGAWQFRPSIGATVNLSGDTNFVYLDFNYGGPISDTWFLEFALGGVVHDGETDTTDPGRKELGSRLLIHAAMSLGVMLSETMSLSLFVDHMSNAGIEERNEGLETAGVRLGFKL